jgi:uncharacterized LabA/DUF88 family protein
MKANSKHLKLPNNFAFIDSQNVHMSTVANGWKLDWFKFRVYLSEKHGVTSAFIFIGMIDKEKNLYKHLQKAGFILIFKPTNRLKDGSYKGNVDAELVLNAMIEYRNFDRAVIISGDGDFACLVEYFLAQDKLEMVIAPARDRCSKLLQLAAGSRISTLDDLKHRLNHVHKKKSTQ